MKKETQGQIEVARWRQRDRKTEECDIENMRSRERERRINK
jgi:hypothetical protein